MSLQPLFDLPTPSKAGDKVAWKLTPGCGLSFALIEACKKLDGPMVVITASSQQAHQLERELKFLCQEHNLALEVFPDWETLPYDSFSPHQDIISERLATLVRLKHKQAGFCIIPISTLMHHLVNKDYLLQSSFMLRTGDTLDLTAFSKRLTDVCYRKVAEVNEHGEFAIRGSILDVYPMGTEHPIRVELFDNEVDTLRFFDPSNQRSQEPVDAIQLLPGAEIPLDDEAIQRFRKNWRLSFEGNPKQCPIYLDISEGLKPAGIEYYLPLFFDELSDFFSFCPPSTSFALLGNMQEAMESFLDQVGYRFEQYRHDRSRPIVPPSQLFLTADQVFAKLSEFKQIKISSQDQVIADSPLEPFPDLSLNPKLENPLSILESFINDSNCRVLLCAESKGRRESLSDLIKRSNLEAQLFERPEAFFESSHPLGITVAPIDLGFFARKAKLAMIAEAQLYGHQVMQRRRRRKAQVVEHDQQIRHLAELKPGDPLVHLQFGVGRYLGLKTMDVGATQAEFLQIQYAGKDKLYVPISHLHLISKYTGAEADNAPLNKLGSDQWDKAKKKALKKAQDVAAELLDVLAKRHAKPGVRIKTPEDSMPKFASQFPFEETPDQQKAIEEVCADMNSATPMDRLVCGDVGFGKTEVAMRAAFQAAMNNFQVAVLVPTTLLAQQHFENFQDRFAEWPIEVGLLSRFRSKSEQTTTLDKLKNGQIDIVVGTHKLLQSDIQFKQLGLLVVDEEHRFGVKQKEQLKKWRAQVDILTLTATPIPRTLNMAFAQLRDLSIIATPPQKRLSVKTFVRERQQALIVEAISRELMRGGQVYFLHNDVSTIEQTANQLAQWVPQARIGFAHGQMREKQLEGIMADFYHQRFNVLVCTTIIENGIDIPSANTILMDRADKLGLAQLHQLRGRVGRSHHQAYAYCLTPPKKSLKSDAIKRLEALEALDELGAGFNLASQDLEIRGAGELLGDSQSGEIQCIGFSLYMSLLEKAVKALKKGEPHLLEDDIHQTIDIDLSISALIPESYIHDVSARLLLYKRLSHAQTQATLDELKVEMIDRFGLLPEPTQHLFRSTQIKQTATELGIKKIEANSQGGKIHFVDKPNINTTKLIEWIRTNPQTYSIRGSELFIFKFEMPNAEDRFKIIEQLIHDLQPEQQTVSH